MDPFSVSFSGIHLVEASAGTGKTYNITSLYIRALIELDISVNNILVVTYTEAATKELKDRLLNRIRESITALKANKVGNKKDEFLADLLAYVSDRQKAIQRLEQAIRTFDEAAVHTIHGFCYQALQEQAFESGAMYDAEMIGDDSELVLEAIDDFWRNWVAEASNDPSKRPLLQYLLDNGYSPDTLASEIGSYLGQPFLEIHPREALSTEDLENELSQLVEIYGEMRDCWEGEQQQILSLLQADQLNGNKYRTTSLPAWFEQMNDCLTAETPPTALFDYF
jgi:exodeoxyribonuclease V beta subunit